LLLCLKDYIINPSNPLKQKPMKNKSGSGLVFAVVLLFVILGMVITLSSLTLLETKMSQKTKSSVGSFYSAESGVEWALNQIASKTETASIATAFSSTGFDGKAAKCPSGFANSCSVYFLGGDGNVLDPAANTIAEIKAVRSVGTQGDETQRAIEAAVAVTGGGCFTYYCNRPDLNPSGSNKCHNNGGSQGYCPSGFQQKYDMGTWGICVDPSSDNYDSRPPGGGCYQTLDYSRDIGNAYVCCL
jgi:Tfp pilus assembly protein PilX